ncbi:hypothetical protein GE21DRAFT_1108844 [Neurospora crassa]|nr:hypothetical protein GE21DRAFT_1108844 [Neurospora crassa]
MWCLEGIQKPASLVFRAAFLLAFIFNLSFYLVSFWCGRRGGTWTRLDRKEGGRRKAIW